MRADDVALPVVGEGLHVDRVDAVGRLAEDADAGGAVVGGLALAGEVAAEDADLGAGERHLAGTDDLELQVELAAAEGARHRAGRGAADIRGTGIERHQPVVVQQHVVLDNHRRALLGGGEQLRAPFRRAAGDQDRAGRAWVAEREHADAARGDAADDGNPLQRVEMGLQRLGRKGAQPAGVGARRDQVLDLPHPDVVRLGARTALGRCVCVVSRSGTRRIACGRARCVGCGRARCVGGARHIAGRGAGC